MIGRDIPPPGGGRLATIRSPEPEDLPEPIDDPDAGSPALHEVREQERKADAETVSTPDPAEDPGEPGTEPTD